MKYDCRLDEISRLSKLLHHRVEVLISQSRVSRLSGFVEFEARDSSPQSGSQHGAGAGGTGRVRRLKKLDRTWHDTTDHRL